MSNTSEESQPPPQAATKEGAPDDDRRTVVDRLVYLTLRLTALPVAWLPLPVSLWGARRLGTLLYWLSGRYRRITLSNLELAYGDELDDAQRRRIAHRVFQNLAMTVFEGIKLPILMRSGKLAGMIQFGGNFRRMQEAGASREPLLLLSGHLGSWELIMASLGLLGVDMVGVVRPTKFPGFNDWMDDLRRGGGQQIATKKGALGDIRDAVRDGKSVGLLIDQHHRHGIMTEFFGRITRTNPVMGILAQRLALPVFIGYVKRVIPGRSYRFFVTGPLSFGDVESAVARSAAITQRCALLLESFIRQMPEQWLWAHRRWKYGPDGIGDGLDSKRLRRRAPAPSGHSGTASSRARKCTGDAG